MAAERYRSDVEPSEAWQGLQNQNDAALVDVRTDAEWTFVGLPDLSALEREIVCVEWRSYPDQSVNPDFVGLLDQALREQGTDPDSPVYFICRSGVRSAHAAAAMTEAGYSQCFNVSGGFEGRPDQARQRGNLNGWKAAGLPWVQP